MAQIKDLTEQQLVDLRQEIVLNSLFTRDYENSFDIDPQECQAFFDGYMEDICDIAKEDGHSDFDIFDVIEVYDTKENLVSYRDSIVWEA